MTLTHAPAAKDEQTARVVRGESEPLSPADVADSIESIASTYARDTSAAGVCVANGIGTAAPRRPGRARRRGRDGRAPTFAVASTKRRTGFSRLVDPRHDRHGHRRRPQVVRAGSGSPSLCSPPTGPPSSPHAEGDRRREAPAHASSAPEEPVGLSIARQLLGAKLRGQAAIVIGRLVTARPARRSSGSPTRWRRPRR